MNDPSWQRLGSSDSLLALGVSLIMAGLILRGFATSARRDAALRRQHWLHGRKPGEVDPTPTETAWWSRHVGTIANVTAIVGVALTVVSFLVK